MARALGSRRQPTVRVWLCRLDRISRVARDRKSTRLNSSHSQISYAEFCLKKKNLSAGGGNLRELSSAIPPFGPDVLVVHDPGPDIRQLSRALRVPAGESDAHDR